MESESLFEPEHTKFYHSESGTYHNVIKIPLATVREKTD